MNQSNSNAPKKDRIFTLVLTAMFAAMICVATMFIRIPTGATDGYANLGDGVILICSFLIPAPYAAAAAGIGSMLADLLLGYAAYAPITLAVKALVGLIAALLYRKLSQRCKPILSHAIAGCAAELFMVFGYFAAEATLLSYGLGTISSIPANLAQGAVGIIASMALMPALLKSRELSDILRRF